MIEAILPAGYPSGEVVAYDAGPGVIASRLWWMLRYMGHRAVAVLDGGIGGERLGYLSVRARKFVLLRNL